MPESFRMRRRGESADGWLRRRRARWLCCALAGSLVGPLQGQGVREGAGGQRAFTVEPRASVTETVSNNVQLSQTQPMSDAVTDLSVGVSLLSSSGRLRGALDYQLSGFRYAQHSEFDTYQNALSARLGAELIESRARIDFTAGITQSSLSAFGVQPGVSGLPASNLTEYRSFEVTPSFSGPLGLAVQYKAGLTYSLSDARGTTAGDSTGDAAFVRIGPLSPGVIGWSVDLTSQHSRYDAGRDTVDNRLNATLSRKIDTLDLLLSATAGVEVTDISSFERARYQNWGIGATWAPSPRTKLVAQFDERFFGNAHELTFEHRTALTTWTFSDTRSLNTSGNGKSTGGRGATYDLYFAQFASIEPDPVKRADLVSNYLKANGLSPSIGADTGYLRSGETVSRGQSAAVAYRGLRGAAVLAYNRNVDVPIDGAPLPSEDFKNTSNIVYETVSLSLSHRLTPVSSANMIVSYQQSHGDHAEQFSSQRQVNLQFLAQLNDRSSLTVGARRSLFKNYQSPYDEGAIFGTYGIRF